MRRFTLSDLKQTPAKQLGVWTTADPEWHELRATRGVVSGTMAGSISGLSKWESAVDLWEKKTGRVSSEIPQTESMYWGSRLESVILDEFQLRHESLTVLTDCGTWIGADEWSLANPDGLVKLPDGSIRLLEIKTAAYPYGWNVPPEGVTGDSEDVPKHYQSQVQWYLRVLGLESATLVALFGGSKYREFTIHADPHWQNADYELAEMFRRAVLDDRKPDWPGAATRLETRKN